MRATEPKLPRPRKQTNSSTEEDWPTTFGALLLLLLSSLIITILVILCNKVFDSVLCVCFWSE